MSEQEKNTEQGVHKRRARYKGKYPRKFEEKYKEFENLLNIEIEKLKNKLIVTDINDILRIMGYDV